jgi:hypothetical protein
MKSIILFLILGLAASLNTMAQNDTIPANDLLGEILTSDNTTQKLLPDRILVTQRIFWGEKGLMRNFDGFKLTPENRAKELKVRRSMLVTHQIMGFATMGGMIAQGIVGAKLYNGDNSLRGTHEALAGFVNFGYFTTASLSLFAPPKMLDERKGYSNIKLHKALAIVHLSGMIATNILASQLESHPNLRPYHRAAAFTTFGAFAASMIVIKF